MCTCLLNVNNLHYNAFDTVLSTCGSMKGTQINEDFDGYICQQHTSFIIALNVFLRVVYFR